MDTSDKHYVLRLKNWIYYEYPNVQTLSGHLTWLFICKLLITGNKTKKSFHEKEPYFLSAVPLSQYQAFKSSAYSVIECENGIRKIKSPKQTLHFKKLHIYYQAQDKILNEQFANNLDRIYWNEYPHRLTKLFNGEYKNAYPEDVNGLAIVFSLRQLFE